MNGHCRWSMATGAFVLRFGLGMLFFFAGLNKFLADGGAAAFIGYIQAQFAETWLPAFATEIFARVLPYAEVVLGALLMLGLARFVAIPLGALLMLDLAFGMMVLGKHDVVMQNMIYVGLFAACLFTSGWDLFAVDTLFYKKKPQPPTT